MPTIKRATYNAAGEIILPEGITELSFLCAELWVNWVVADRGDINKTIADYNAAANKYNGLVQKNIMQILKVPKRQKRFAPFEQISFLTTKNKRKNGS